MSQLANLIRDIRGKKTQKDFSLLVGVAPQTISKIEVTNGKSDPSKISLTTIYRISRKLHLPREKHLELIQAWIRLQLGNDFHEFDIHPKTTTLKENNSSFMSQVLQMSPDLSAEDQKIVLAALKSPEIRKAIKAMMSFAKNE
ncbi:MAG TPA: helix-turn-helix transcriptional regulator [Verrucomicrobiae bacterium]